MLGQTTVPVSFRRFEPSDYERLVDVYNANFPDFPSSVEEVRHNDESSDPSKYYKNRLVCLSGDLTVPVGFGMVAHAWWNYHPHKYVVDMAVDPRYQGRGIGSRIYQEILAELADLKAVAAWASVKENMAGSMGFAQKRGFVEKQRLWESWLNPQEFDPQPFQGYLERTSRAGIRISTLAEMIAKGPESLREVYELDQVAWMDVPLPVPYTRVSYEQWEAKQLKSPTQLLDGYFIASDGSRYIGYSNVWRTEREPRTLLQYMTGVRREYRGRGVAMALKLKVIDFGRRNGYDRIKTMNDSLNSPMLGINVKLGFKRQVGWITMEKNMA